jgi:hypothetical protein
MKRSVVLTVVLALVSLAFITIFAVSEGATPQLLQQQVPEPNLLERLGLPEVPGITGPRIEPNMLADPNKVRAKVRSFEGLEKMLVDVDRQSQSNEMNEWLKSTTDNRMNQVRAVERQVRAELDAIRKIAVEEKAVKTVAAIDGIALNRQERFRKLLKKIEEEAKTLRQPRGTRIRGREITPEGAAVQGQEFGQDANQPRLRPRRR